MSYALHYFQRDVWPAIFYSVVIAIILYYVAGLSLNLTYTVGAVIFLVLFLPSFLQPQQTGWKRNSAGLFVGSGLK